MKTPLFHLQEEAKPCYHTVRGKRHNHACGEHAAKDRGQGVFHTHIHQRRDKCARPRARSRQGDGNEEKKTKGRVAQHLIRVFFCLFLKPQSNTREVARSLHPLKNMANKQQDKGYGQKVAQHADQIIGVNGQTKNSTNGNGTAQLKIEIFL